MSEPVVIDRRFRGPPDSANGGYACGMLAAHLEPGPAVRGDPAGAPAARPRRSRSRRANRAARAAGRRHAGGRGPRRPSARASRSPSPVGLEDAERAREGSPMQTGPPLSECFVCGPDRAPRRRALRHLRAGARTRGRAGRGTVRDRRDDGRRRRQPSPRARLVGARLPQRDRRDARARPGDQRARAAHRPDPPTPSRPATTTSRSGWPTGRDGRKCFSATAIARPRGGETLAVAKATWIELAAAAGHGS